MLSLIVSKLITNKLLLIQAGHVSPDTSFCFDSGSSQTYRSTLGLFSALYATSITYKVNAMLRFSCQLWRLDIVESEGDEKKPRALQQYLRNHNCVCTNVTLCG